MELIRLEGLSFRFPGRRSPLFKDLNLVIHRGDRLLLHGPSGSGKSTLLAILAGLVPAYVGGELTGSLRLSYTRKALVLQNPEAQVITPTVEEELAFPLENRAMPVDEMELRITTMLARFGMAGFRYRNPLELSGGECQRLSLAVGLIQEPEVLFLDEPTSYLDEERSRQLFQDLAKLPDEVTVVMVEHRLELVEAFCTRWVQIDEGSLAEQASWEAVLARTPSLELPENGHGAATPVLTTAAAPMADRAEAHAPDSTLVSRTLGGRTRMGDPNGPSPTAPFILEIRGLSHRYPPNGTAPPAFAGPAAASAASAASAVPAAPILHNLDLSLAPGGITAIIGPSGSGKTTLLKKILRLLPVEQGTIWFSGQDISTMKRDKYYRHLAYIPQNPEHLFLEDTVAEELALSSENREEALKLATLFSLNHRLKAHPFKLSEGEKRRLTLCIALAMKRPLIIMDEPTYGLDRLSRHRLVEYLHLPELAETSILLVSHDSPFIKALGCKTLRLTEGHLEEAEL